MKVVHVLTRFLKAGSEENTLLTCEGQLAAGHEVHIVHGDEYDPAVVGNIDHRIHVHRLPAMVHPVRPLQDLRACTAMTALFRQLAPDVVHTHQSKAGVIGRWAARRAGVPHVVHGVHIVSFDNVSLTSRLVYLAAEHLAARWTDAFVHVSQGVRRSYERQGIGAGKPHEVVYSGMDIGKFVDATPPQDWRELLGLPAGAPKPLVALMLAAYEPRKRQLQLVEAFARLQAAQAGVHLLLAGGGHQRDDVRAAAEAAGVAAHVTALGFHARPQELVALADVCLLTSEREGLPRVVVQYLAGGKPAIVSRVEGIEEIVEHGVNGLITPADDVGAAVRALLQLAQDPILRERLAAGARRADVQRWDRSKMHVGMQRAYASIGAVAHA
jgi:glycosyltransferase involved in cell wall biosynthesis